jgi:nitrate reductase assembly molybdenum cofactor insertion protein NarJ
MSEIRISEDVRQLIEESVAWRMFSLAFERPRNGWREHVASIASDVADPDVRGVAELAKEQASEELFLDLFGPGGSISPREVAYRGLADPGHLLAALETIYGAFAYAPKSEECPDHVSVEAGFVGFLKLKQAFARIAGDAEAESIAKDAEAMFVADHLAPVAAGLCSRLDGDDAFYVARAARLMRERIGDVPVPEIVEPADDDEMGCAGGCPIEQE